jgi:hypothetical protein
VTSEEYIKYMTLCTAVFLASLPLALLTSKGKGEGIVHPRTGHEGPEGEKRYSCTPSLTSALDEVWFY